MAQERFQGPDGTIYEARPGGGYLVVPPSGGATIPLGPRDPSKVRAEARADAAADRAAAAAERAARNDERRLELAEEEAARKRTGGTGKAMRQGDADKLESQLNAYSYLKDSVGTFDDKFAGNAATGELENWAQGKLGTGTPGQRDWWANFRTADNLIRNELFGASLTGGEKAAYAATTVDPSMKPDVVRKNLARRAEIAKEVLSRRTARLHNTYNKDEVEAALGDFAPELLPQKVRQERGIPDPQMEVATGDTRTEITRTELDNKIASMLKSGASAESIKRAAGNEYPGLDATLAYRSLNPGYKGEYDVSTKRVVPTSMLNKAMASPLATIATQAANATTGGLLDEIGGAANSLVTGDPLEDTIAAANLAKQAQARLNPTSALAGNVLGGAAAMLGGGAALRSLGVGKGAWATTNPIKAAAVGDAGYGALYGAGESNDNRVMGAAVGAPAALAGSLAGSGFANATGKVVRGVVNPAAERLRARGIPLTAGEVLGGGWKKAQDAGTSVWGPGNLMSARYGEGREALNRAAFNEAGAIVDTPINAVGRHAVQALDAAKSAAYGAALDPVTLDLTDPQFANDIRALGTQIMKIPNSDPRQVAFEALEGRIKNNLDPGTSNMAGRNFQEAYRGLSREGKEQRPYSYEIGGVTRGGQDALASALERQNPGAYGGFLKANSANRHLSILQDALKAAKGQIEDGDAMFTPAQLGTASTNNTAKFSGKLAAVDGSRPFDELITDSQQVMSQKIGDSGTAGRAMFGGAMLGAGGLGYGADGGSGAAVGALTPLAIASLMNTRAGQTLLTKTLLERIAPFKKAGNYMIDRAPVAGAVGAGFAIPTFAGQ